MSVPLLFQEGWAYWLDAWERTHLFWEVLHQRSARYEQHNRDPIPHVLDFGSEVIVDGRQLARPVNYLLMRIRRLRAAVSIRSSAPLLSSILARGTGQASATSSRTARSA